MNSEATRGKERRTRHARRDEMLLIRAAIRRLEEGNHGKCASCGQSIAENRLKALQGDVQGRVDDKKSTIATTAAAGGMVLLVIFFLLGRRSGKKRSAVVEIRRI